MTEKTAPIESNIAADSNRIQLKDDDNIESLIVPLAEPVISVSQSVQSSPSVGQRFSGIIYALLSAFLLTISMFITKQLQVELLFALIPRYLVQTILLIVYMKLIKHYSFYKQSKRREIFLLIFNVFCSATGFLAVFIAYRYLPLPDVITIRYTQVIWVAVITIILYREKPSIPVILATLLTILGVTCVAQPSFLFRKTSSITTDKISSTDDQQQRYIGLIIALYASVAMSIMIITNKHLLMKYRTKPSLIMLQFTSVSLWISIVYLFYEYYSRSDTIQSLKRDFLNWRYLCASSVCLLQIFASIMVQKAIKREHPSIFTIVQSSDILFPILLQNLFTSVKSNFLSLFGSILVLISILITSGFKFINDKKTKKHIVQK